MRDHDDTLHQEVQFAESSHGVSGPAAARIGPKAAQILGLHYRALRQAAAPSRTEPDEDSPAQGAQGPSVAAAFLLRVLNERSMALRGQESSADQELRGVRRALRQLAAEAPRLAETLALHELAGLSSAEVAAMLGTDVGGVERDLRDARARIASKLPR